MLRAMLCVWQKANPLCYHEIEKRLSTCYDIHMQYKSHHALVKMLKYFMGCPFYDWYFVDLVEYIFFTTFLHRVFPLWQQNK